MPRLVRGTPRIVRAQAVTVGLLVVLLPLVRGGVPAVARGLLVATAVALFAVEWLPRAAAGQGPDARERAWLGMWAVVAGLLTLQLVPLPAAWLAHLGAWPDGFATLSDVALRRISPVPAATLHFGAIFSAYWCVAFVVSRLPARQVSFVVGALVALAVFEALYGTIALSRGAETILGVWSREHYPNDATGTYVNRNPYAGLLGLAWPVGLAWLGLRRLRPLRAGRPVIRAAACGLFSTLIGIALVASHSRMGLLAALAGLATWLGLRGWSRRAAGSGRRARTAPALEVGVVLAALLGAVWFGAAPWLERLQQLPTNRVRWIAWQSVFDLPTSTWLLGAGAGSFADVFKTVQPAVLNKSLFYAHSDWLELLVDFGVVGVAALVAGALFWWRRVRPGRLSSLQHGALAGICAVGVHILVDFDLHIPGTALAFWVLVGIVANERLAVRSSGWRHV